MFLSVYVLQKDALSNLGAVDVNRDRQKIKEEFDDHLHLLSLVKEVSLVVHFFS